MMGRRPYPLSSLVLSEDGEGASSKPASCWKGFAPAGTNAASSHGEQDRLPNVWEKRDFPLSRFPDVA